MERSRSGLVRTMVPPIALGVIILAIWQGAVTALDIKPFIVPGPIAIWGEFKQNIGNVLEAASRTGLNALIGLVAGLVCGALFALAAAAWRHFEWMTSLVVTVLAVMPIVVLAPILYTMFGTDVDTSRQIVAGLSAFVPVFYNTLSGLKRVLPVHQDLMKVYAVGRIQFARRVAIPTSIPYLFTGLRIASSLAVISALVSEYLGGPSTGLGKAITTAASSSNYARAWAFVLGSILLGLVFYIVARGVEYLISKRFRSKDS